MKIRPRQAFTLVELLVVITIIGILMGLLLPAVNSAREAARRTQCGVNMKNLALAAIQHESSKGYLPPFVDKYGVFGNQNGGALSPAGDPGDPSVGTVNPHVKVGGYGVAILPWLEAQPTFEQWTEDRYPIISNGMGDISNSSTVGASNSGDGFHGNAAPNLAIFQCPSNPVTDADQGLNSYISNNGVSQISRAQYTALDSIAQEQESGIPTAARVTGSPNPPNGLTSAQFFSKLVQDKNNATSHFGYAGGDPGDSTANPAVVVGDRVSLDDLKDGQGFTALYSENVQALPWYLPGFVNAADMLGPVANGMPGEFDLNLSGTSLAFRYMRAQHTAGMVWHFEDTDPDSLQNLNPPLNPRRIGQNGGSVPVSRVHQIHRINGRGSQTSEDLFTLQMSFNNAVDLARPSSAHVEGVQVGFADGANRFVTESIDYRVYQAMLTPRGKSSDVPFPEFTLTEEIGQ